MGAGVGGTTMSDLESGTAGVVTGGPGSFCRQDLAEPSIAWVGVAGTSSTFWTVRGSVSRGAGWNRHV